MNTIKQILICDDVADDALLLKAILSADDCYIEIANSGKEILNFLENTSILPNLLILDVMMPVMDGFEVIEHIQESNKLKKIPVLLVTAIDFGDIKDNKNIKIDGYIQKPIDFDSVVSQVKKILD
jgi:CheY-like chemotaxis protein